MDAGTLIVGMFIFLIMLTFFGGLLSLAIEKTYHANNPHWFEKMYHRPYWSKDLKIAPRHKDCFECDIEVRKLEEIHARRDAARRS